VPLGVRSLLVVLLFGAGGWGALALWFKPPPGSRWRSPLTAVWLLWCVALLAGLLRGPPLPAALLFAGSWLALLLYWWQLRPSNAGDWADEVARISNGEVDGDQVTVHEVRNFDWRTRSDYTARWETRRYDLRTLCSLDMITSYWEGPAIAHVLLSFGFADGEQLVFSVEIRRRRGQAYSEVGGFFKAFNLSIIAGDERDLLRLRTNVRGEDDYLYRIMLPPAARRALLLAYIAQANALVQQARFYNTLTVNCTTLVYRMMRHIIGGLPLDVRLVLSGYLPGYVYAVGGLDRRYTLEQLRACGRITERARQADRSPQFSAAIRSGIPPLPPDALSAPGGVP
jgi:Domain of unknown function (DUF4105)